MSKYIDESGLNYLWGKVKSYVSGLGFYTKPSTGIPTSDIASGVIPTESTVTGWGFTKNAGTITGITMNGTSKGTSGVVDLGTVITSHQDISGKANISDLADIATSGDYNDLLNVPDVAIISSSDSTKDLTIEDEQGNVLARFLDGHFEVRNFSTANKVTSISSSSTDAQFPSAKCVYDLVGDIETLLAAI